MRLILFGPPGAGKGTQAQLLKERCGLHHLSTGDLFRAALQAGTTVGREAQAYIERGELVPDDVVWAIAREALGALGADDFILDGYPRTVPQAERLDAYLKAAGGPAPLVLSLTVDDAVLVERLSRRRIDCETGASYHLDFNPPPPDLPAERVVRRPDDCPEAIRQRLAVYHAQTEPVKQHYAAQHHLVEVDGDGGIEEVFERTVAALERSAKVEVRSANEGPAVSPCQDDVLGPSGRRHDLISGEDHRKATTSTFDLRTSPFT